MVFIRFKTVKSTSGKMHVYAYKCKSIWNKKKQQCQQKVVGYIGKVHDMHSIDVKRIFKRDNYECQYCKSKEDLVIDHIIPLSKYGTNHDNNLQVLCKLCNMKKGKGELDHETIINSLKSKQLRTQKKELIKKYRKKGL